VSLEEGDTPLIPAPAVSELTGCEVWLKYEGLNPTGSFKDRGMTVAVSAAIEEGAEAVICASTGNTAASAAA
jgi:threonine synthase